MANECIAHSITTLPHFTVHSSLKNCLSIPTPLPIQHLTKALLQPHKRPPSLHRTHNGCTLSFVPHHCHEPASVVGQAGRRCIGAQGPIGQKSRAVRNVQRIRHVTLTKLLIGADVNHHGFAWLFTEFAQQQVPVRDQTTKTNILDVPAACGFNTAIHCVSLVADTVSLVAATAPHVSSTAPLVAATAPHVAATALHVAATSALTGAATIWRLGDSGVNLSLWFQSAKPYEVMSRNLR